jgi:adenine-specific DNA methylase
MEHARLPVRTILEHGTLPLHELALFAQREGRRPRAIYTAHKWFARRLATVFRALLVGAVSGPDDDFWEAYYGSADLKGLRILDPFVGGGTSVVEAGRLGANTWGVDVDPIACSVTRLELMAAQMPDLGDALAELQESIGRELQAHHRFRSPDGSEYQVLHHFWVQVVTCTNCDTDFDAHPNFQLAHDGKRQWAFCSGCGAVDVRRAHHKTMCCGSCGTRTSIMDGRVDYGRATCPECDHREQLIEVGRRTGKTPRWRQFAVEVLEQPDGGRPVPLEHRRFFASGTEGTKRFTAAVKALEARRLGGPLFPASEISNTARFDSRLIDYGYRCWTELFNERQLLHLSVLSEAIQTYDEPVRTALAMAFSDHLTTNCMLTSYAAGWRRLTPLFSVRAFRHVPRPVELNPWADGSGRGSFPNTVRKLMRAAAYARAPKEPVIAGGFRAVPSVESDEAPVVRCGTSQDLSFLPDASVDLVLTDPPYFDNIAYSELAEFFLPWLRLLDVVSPDSGLEQVMLDSLGGRRGDAESLEKYTAGLSGVFSEVARVVKPSGIMVFSYRHAVPEAWLALAKAIAPHPLTAVRAFPAPGEAGVGLHAHEGTGLWDAVFVFRRDVEVAGTTREPLAITNRQRSAAAAKAAVWRETLADCALSFSAVDEETMRRASLVAAALHGSSPKTGASTELLQALSR